jgi:molecular chaperone GrpE
MSKNKKSNGSTAKYKSEKEEKHVERQEKSSQSRDPKKINKKEDELKKEIETLESQLRGALSDYQNLKREMEKRLDLERNLIRRELVEDVIGLADDIDIAIDHVEDEKGWREGVSQILEKFRKTIKDMGAEIIKCKPGDKFDSSIHEAVAVSDKGKDGTIQTVVQNGYRVGDIVIRPARVIVNKISNKKKDE